jgi:hypothetical protein
MARSKISDDHHVVRHCRKRLTIRRNNAIVGVHPNVFFLRKNVRGTNATEEYLSCAFYEHFAGDADFKMHSCERTTPVANKQLDDAMVRLNVGSVRAQGALKRRTLRIWNEVDKPNNPAYSGIEGFPAEPDLDLIQALFENSIVQIEAIGAIRAAPGHAL